MMSTSAPLSTCRTIAHLCQNDLRRFRLLVAAAIGVDLMAQGYAEWMLHLAPTVIGEQFGGAGGQMETELFDLAIWATTWIVTAVVVQADHPSDDRAFWRTRPLAPHAVALAKLAFLGLTFVVVPAMVNAARLAAYGAPASAHVAASVQIAVIALGGIVPAWGLAILTKTLPRFLAGIAVSVAGAYLLFMATLFYIGLAGGGVGSTSIGIGIGGAGEWARAAPFGWLGSLAFSAAVLGILVAHYRFRRVGAALAAGAALLVVPVAIPWGPSSAPPADLARLVREPLRPASLEVDAGFPADGSSLAILAGRLALPGLPPDVSAGISVDRVRVLVDGRDVAVNGLPQCCLGAAGPIAAASATPTTLPSADGPSDELAVVRAAAVPDLRTKPVTLNAEATVVFMRHRLAAAIPFTAGASFRGEGYVVDVLSLSDRGAASSRIRAALLRVTVFPRLARGGGPQLSFFEADPLRMIVNRATAPYPLQSQPSRSVYEWAQARRWAMRFHSIVLQAQDVGPDPRLLIVESRSAGEVSARVAWDGGPAAAR